MNRSFPFSNVIFGQHSRPEYHDGDLVLRPWHFPVFCPDCEFVFTSLDQIIRGTLPQDLDISPGFLDLVVTQRCRICLDKMVLNYDHPETITQAHVDRHPVVSSDSQLSGKFGAIEIMGSIIWKVLSLANPENEIRFMIFFALVIGSPFILNEILEWIFVLFIA